MKLFICSSASRPLSGLNLGNHFSGQAGNWCKGLAILTAPGLVHGLGEFCAIAGMWVGEGVAVVEGDLAEEDVVPVPVWIMIWSGKVDDWSRDGIDGKNEDDERTSMWDSDGVFLASLWLGKGNSNRGIPRFSLCDLVNRWDGVN